MTPTLGPDIDIDIDLDGDGVRDKSGQRFTEPPAKEVAEAALQKVATGRSPRNEQTAAAQLGETRPRPQRCGSTIGRVPAQL